MFHVVNEFNFYDPMTARGIYTGVAFASLFVRIDGH
jgi:hypothetical protein